jgi:hypothetical protein
MKKIIFSLTILVICAFMIGACGSRTSSLRATQEPTETLYLGGKTAVVTFKSSSPQHFQTSSGLTVDQYVLKGGPDVEPLHFEPIQGSQDEIVSTHAAEKEDEFSDNSFFENFLFGRKALLSDKNLVAQEVINDTQDVKYQKVSVVVSLDKKKIYTIKAGDVSPAQALQGLWTYDKHWMLEIAYVGATNNSKDNSRSYNTTGQIVQDGELLNDKYGYQEAFGSQLLNDRPFYFFKKDGKIGISYDGQTSELGYDEVPHYGCCSAAEMNPKPTKDMVSFFAKENGTWYYIEIGVFK